MKEAKRTLLSTAVTSESEAHLTPAKAVRALRSLTHLDGLDGRALAALLGVALSPAASAPAAGPSLQAVCAACCWAQAARTRLGALEPPEPGSGAVSGGEALSQVAAAARVALGLVDLRGLRVMPGGQRCLVPRLAGAPGAGAGAAVTVDGEHLLAAAELLAQRGASPEDARLVAALLDAACRPGAADAWPEALQVRWLRLGVAASAAAESRGVACPTASAAPLLAALAGRQPHRLVPQAADIFEALPAVAAADGARAAAEAAALAFMLAEEVESNLFRLTLREAHVVTRGCARLVEGLSAEHASRLRPLAAALLRTAAETLPAKCRSEGVFHRREEGLAAADVAAWCELLADTELLRGEDKLSE